MALSPNSAGLLAEVLLDGSSQLVYTVPANQMAVIKELLFDCLANSTIEYCIGGNAAGQVHLQKTFMDANQVFREIINYPLAAGTTVYAWRDANGTVNLKILGNAWNV